MSGPTTDAGRRLLDYILSGFEGDDDPAELVVAVERAAWAWGKLRGMEAVQRDRAQQDMALRQALTVMLSEPEGRVEDIFGLWVQGQQSLEWVVDRLVSEGHARALARLLR